MSMCEIELLDEWEKSMFYFYRTVRANEIKVDSRVMTFRAAVTPDERNKSTTSLNYFELEAKCVVDDRRLKYNPIKMRFHHKDKTTAQRKLLWHKTGIDTKVAFNISFALAIVCCTVPLKHLSLGH